MLMFISTNSDAQTKTIKLYLSADFTGTKESGISIKQGIETALKEINNQIGDYSIKLVTLDHRGSSPRAKKHLLQYLNDPQALVLFSGLHSPPLLANREFINLNQILVLDPWAAAGPITRYPAKENWIFRLSIDDTKAGKVITDYAMSKGVKTPALLLEQTGWGKSNFKTMNSALNKQMITPLLTKWFNWGLSVNNARIMLREIKQNGADAIFLVANAPEGKVIAKAMASLPKDHRLPIYSHWGITGGNFAEEINLETRSKFSLSFIQTSFSFLGELNSFQQQVLNNAIKFFPNSINQAIDIKAPTGFIHAYDLSQIMIAALKQKPLNGNIKNLRKQLREELENIKTPVQGLIKVYTQPFSEYSSQNTDAHEALNESDFVMARFGSQNEIIVEKNNQ